MSEINLLPQKNKGFLSEERLLLFTKVGSVTSIILVVSLSILFYLLSRDTTLANVKADESRTIAQLTILQSKTAKYLIIIDRVNKIKTLSQRRSNFDTTMSSVVQLIPNGVSLTNFMMDKDSFTVAVSTTDLSLCGKLINNFSQQIAQKKLFKSLTIESLVTDEKAGTYVLTLDGTLL